MHLVPWELAEQLRSVEIILLLWGEEGDGEVRFA